MSGHRPSWLAFGVMAATVALALAGHAAGWYENLGWADELAYFAVSFGIAMYISALLEHRLATAALGAGWRVAIVVCATLTLGVTWEILEWLFRVQATASTVLPADDTARDFVFAGLGAIGGALLGVGLGHRREPARA